MTTTPKHRLRWYQYSLRSLFVLTVLVAIGGSWFAWKRQQKERERAVVNWVEEKGGRVLYDWQWEAARNPNAQPPGPAWLRQWLGDDYFAHVVYVDVSRRPLTDADLELVKGLRQLKILRLDNTQVTDAGLEHLQGLTQLETLWLANTQVTDAGLQNLKGLAQLKKLFLSQTQLTDAGLENLKGLVQLRILDLRLVKVTGEGVQRLQNSLPDCFIDH